MLDARIWADARAGDGTCSNPIQRNRCLGSMASQCSCRFKFRASKKRCAATKASSSTCSLSNTAKLLWHRVWARKSVTEGWYRMGCYCRQWWNHQICIKYKRALFIDYRLCRAISKPCTYGILVFNSFSSILQSKVGIDGLVMRVPILGSVQIPSAATGLLPAWWLERSLEQK